MANELHELLYNLSVSERWNLPLQILERDVQALREDVFPEKKRKAPLIEDRLSPRKPPFPAIYPKIEKPTRVPTLEIYET
jgi:hypothetical protein